MEFKFSIREGMAPGSSIAEKFENLKQMGFAGIEITSPPTEQLLEAVLEASRATGIVPNIASSKHLNILDPRPEERDRCIQSIKEALSFCGEVGGVGVIVVPLIVTKMQNLPRIPDLSPFMSQAELERAVLNSILTELADHCQAVGADVIIEPLNRYEQWWPCTLQDGVSICEDVGKPGISMMADFFHMHIEDAHFDESIRAAAKYLKNVHLADSQRWLPGYGHTDFRPGLAALDEIGYEYYMGFECAIPGDPFEELPKAMDYLREQAP